MQADWLFRAHAPAIGKPEASQVAE